MDVGAREVGLIDTAITRWRDLAQTPAAIPSEYAMP